MLNGALNIHARILSAKEDKEGSIIKHIVPWLTRLTFSKSEYAVEERVTRASLVGASLQTSIRQQNINQMMISSARSQGDFKTNALLKLEIIKATRAMYGKIITIVFTLYSVTVLSLGISWTATPANLDGNVITGLQLSIVALHVVFFICAFFL